MLDVGQGSEYAAGYHGKLFKRFGKVMDFFVMLWESDEIFVSYILKNST